MGITDFLKNPSGELQKSGNALGGILAVLAGGMLNKTDQRDPRQKAGATAKKTTAKKSVPTMNSGAFGKLNDNTSLYGRNGSTATHALKKATKPVVKPVAKPAASSFPRDSSPIDSWKPDTGGLDANRMAADEYASLKKMLANERSQTTAAYDKAGTEVGGLYAKLSKDMLGQSGAIQKEYDTTGSKIGSRYNEAIASTDAGYSKSRNETADIAQRLGLQQGIPSALSGGSEMQGRLDGLLQAQKANAQTTNDLFGRSAVSYNRDNANINAGRGVTARADFKDRMLGSLNGLSNKSLDINAQQSSAANKYKLSLADMIAQQKSAHATDISNQIGDRARNANTQENNRAKSVMDQAKFAESIRQFDIKNSSKSADTSKDTAYQTLAAESDKAYGGVRADAQKAQKIIGDMFTGGWGGDSNWSSATDFVQDVIRSNPAADSSQLRQLAAMFYAKMAGGAGKSYAGGAGRKDWNG